jgi:hypothetical protein
MLSKDKDLVAGGVVQMLRAGEKSGTLGDICDKISIFYEKKLKSSISYQAKNTLPIVGLARLHRKSCVGMRGLKNNFFPAEARVFHQNND